MYDKSLDVASLFCGCGGSDIGFKGGFRFLNAFYPTHDVRIVYANDIDKYSVRMFEENLGFPCDVRDIRDVESSDIPDVDILIGGFPCQSFSVIAQNPKRLGFKDPRGQLFFEMARVIRGKKPLCFVAENVKGILSANDKQAFPLIIDEFRDCGYNVSYKVLNAADFGVPQKRERVFIVGFRNDLEATYSFPNPSVSSQVPLSVVLIDKDSIEERYYFSERAVDGMKRASKHMNKGRAQDTNNPCSTLGSHLSKVSLNSTDPVLLIDGRFRRFTPREVARIQSFPDTYVLSGPEGRLYHALGNAIPPVLMWHIADSILDQLRGLLD